MHMILRGLVAVALTLTLAFTWYVSQPLVYSIASTSESITQVGNWNTTGSGQTFTLIRLSVDIGIALAILFLWIWFFISAQESDWTGYEYET